MASPLYPFEPVAEGLPSRQRGPNGKSYQSRVPRVLQQVFLDPQLPDMFREPQRLICSLSRRESGRARSPSRVFVRFLCPETPLHTKGSKCPLHSCRKEPCPDNPNKKTTFPEEKLFQEKEGSSSSQAPFARRYRARLRIWGFASPMWPVRQEAVHLSFFVSGLEFVERDPRIVPRSGRKKKQKTSKCRLVHRQYLSGRRMTNC